MSPLRLVSSPSTSPSQPFTFALPPPPVSPPTPHHAPLAPSMRFDHDSMHVFGARPMDDQGKEHTMYRCPNGCGRVIMAASLMEHIKTCSSGTREDSNTGARRPGLAVLNTGSAYKKGKNGLKRGESEVSPTPSETPSKKRARYSPSRSVGSVDTSYPSQSAHEMSQSGTTTAGGNGKEKDRTVGVIDSDDGRMWLENGRKETKKQMSKRMAEERRVQKREELAERERVKAGLGMRAVVVVPDLKVKKPTGTKPIKEYEPDKHCGVQNDLGNPCVRKLDCKIHTVGDKRNVTGRTMSYDDCLRVYRGEAPRGNGPETGNGSGLGTGDAGANRGIKRARKRGGVGAMDDASARRRLGLGVDTDAKEEDWAAHPVAAMHEFAALLESVRRENVLLEGLVRRRAYDELDGRVVGRGSVGGQQSSKGRKAERKDESATVPPPTQDTARPESNAVQDTEVQQPAFGGFGFLEAPASVPPPSNKATVQGVKDEQAIDKSPKAATGQAKPAAGVPTPTYGPNLLARETFAGGATTGSWHFDRRRMLGAEKCFGDILAQLQG